MTHEEALEAGLQTWFKDGDWDYVNSHKEAIRKDFEASVAAYLKARSAILCQSTPTCWTNLENLETPNIKPSMATKKHPDHVERSTFNIPLHQPLKD